MEEPKSLIALSMKGGVGKTTVSISLTRALLGQGHKTGLLDLDIHGSAVPRALQLERPPGYKALAGAKLRPVTFDGFQMFSIGLLFKEDTPNMWSGAMKTQAVQQIVEFAIDWDPDMEWLVVDTPPTSGDEVQSLLQHLPNIYGAVIVTQPNDLSLLGIVKTLNMLRVKQIPICGILTNMAGYTCPHCGQVSNPFDRDTVDTEELAKSYGVAHLGHIPFAGEAERNEAMTGVLQRILEIPPVTLHKDGPSLRRRIIGAILH